MRKLDEGSSSTLNLTVYVSRVFDRNRNVAILFGGNLLLATSTQNRGVGVSRRYLKQDESGSIEYGLSPLFCRA